MVGTGLPPHKAHREAVLSAPSWSMWQGWGRNNCWPQSSEEHLPHCTAMAICIFPPQSTLWGLCGKTPGRIVWIVNAYIQGLGFRSCQKFSYRIYEKNDCKSSILDKAFCLLLPSLQSLIMTSSDKLLRNMDLYVIRLTSLEWPIKNLFYWTWHV